MPRMTWITRNPIRFAVEALIRWLMTTFVMRRHLGRISGLHNLPASGPYMIMCNHTSNFDQYLMGLLVWRLFRRDIKFLVKQEYVQGRLSWIKAPLFKQMGAIPFDRDNPDPVIMGEVLAHLNGGGVISIFPEGTRGDGVKLLPFMPGPFRLAVSAGVPIVPIGLTGTQRILPKDRRFPRSGRATVVIGEPIAYSRNAAMRSYGLDHLVKRGRDTVDALWAQARAASVDPDFGVVAAADAIVAAEHLIEEAHAATDRDVRMRALAAARSMLWMARHNDRGNAVYERDAAGVATLFAAATRWPRNAAETIRARILGHSALLRTPDDPVANYVMGTWNLQTPVLVGGSRGKAVVLLEHAHEVAPGDERIASALAEAYRVSGDVDRAQELLGHLARAS